MAMQMLCPIKADGFPIPNTKILFVTPHLCQPLASLSKYTPVYLLFTLTHIFLPILVKGKVQQENVLSEAVGWTATSRRPPHWGMKKCSPVERAFRQTLNRLIFHTDMLCH